VPIFLSSPSITFCPLPIELLCTTVPPFSTESSSVYWTCPCASFADFFLVLGYGSRQFFFFYPSACCRRHLILCFLVDVVAIFSIRAFFRSHPIFCFFVVPALPPATISRLVPYSCLSGSGPPPASLPFVRLSPFLSWMCRCEKEFPPSPPHQSHFSLKPSKHPLPSFHSPYILFPPPPCAAVFSGVVFPFLGCLESAVRSIAASRFSPCLLQPIPLHGLLSINHSSPRWLYSGFFFILETFQVLPCRRSVQ